MLRLPARPVGLFAVTSAVLALLFVPLLSLAYLATGDGRQYLEAATVRGWAEPVGALAEPLLTWGSADQVYATYLRAVALLFPAVPLCALTVRAGREPASRTERWGWRLALAGYVLAIAALLSVSVILLVDGTGLALDMAYVALLLPGTLLTAVGSTVLGIGLLRARFQPRPAAWLLALALPSVVVLPTLLGHNSLGVLPLFVAWGLVGRCLAHGGAVDAATSTSRASASGSAVR